MIAEIVVYSDDMKHVARSGPIDVEHLKYIDDKKVILWHAYETCRLKLEEKVKENI